MAKIFLIFPFAVTVIIANFAQKTRCHAFDKQSNSKKFDMNYQQLKPGCCDVFVWIAVWHDKIDYWVMSSKTAQENPLLSNQHRASQMTEAGDVVEGQIHINNGNYETFEPYRVKSRDIYAMIKRCKQES